MSRGRGVKRIENEGNAGMEKLDIFPERDNADGVG